MQALLEYRDSGAEAAYGALILVLQAFLDASSGDFARAINTLKNVEPVMERDRSHWSHMGPSVGMLRTLYCLQSGQTQPALRWAAEQEHSLLRHFGFMHEEDRIVLARCMALQDRQTEALDLLQRIEADTKEHDRLINLVRAKVARSLVLVVDDLTLASKILLEALTLSEAPGYRRLFLDEAPALKPILNELADAGYRGWWHVMLEKNRSPHAQGLIEPLTSREQEVLNMIAQGHRNQSIADTLQIAVTTTKSHIRNIYEKMSVNSRTQAVAKAREIGLLR